MLAANHVLVPPLSRDEVRRAIECPAERAGLQVEPELTDRLIADVERQAGALPLLSTALLELWQRRDGRRLRLSAYAETGGVSGAVARLAENAFRARPGAAGVARELLLRLTAEGADGAVERRRVPREELEVRTGPARPTSLRADRPRLVTSRRRRRALARGAAARVAAAAHVDRRGPRRPADPARLTRGPGVGPPQRDERRSTAARG